MNSADTRLVQTAVIGSRDSTRAIVLPTDANALVRWRRRHPAYTYWCGIQLGGCGHELSDRLYRDKVCHFAHRPHTSCHRTATGADSADHLFIRDDLAAWAGRHRLKGRVTSHDLGSGPGGAVDFRLGEARQHVRFQFSRLPHEEWHGTRDRLVRESTTLDWVFGPGTAHPDTMEELYDEQGHLLRFRFETVGAVRRIRLRAEDPRRSTDWVPLDACAMTPDGLSVPGAPPRRAGTARAAVRPTAASTPEPGRRSYDDQVSAAREALVGAARLRTRPTWEALARSAGGDLLELSVPERVRLLVAVESLAAGRDDPLLSALLRTDESDPPAYVGAVVAALGCGTPATAGVLKRWCQREADRAFAVHGVPARTAPPRLSLTADGRIAAQGAEPPQHRTIVHVRGGTVRATAGRPKGAAGRDGVARSRDTELRHALAAARRRRGTRRAEALLKEAEGALTRLPEPQRGQLLKEVEATRGWLRAGPGKPGPKRKRRAQAVAAQSAKPSAKPGATAQVKSKAQGKAKTRTEPAARSRARVSDRLRDARPLPGFSGPAPAKKKTS
ncbi:competence protein CoiA [Streptomyces sp. A012304]|uniref:competence protein CoiA n=1 Tax=Streptomyces sp. A012304 TaxID=375446 RepID=UPI00223125B6|nr:competence protein CoiA [Streptomyces sp. A012304]GKQ41539.1 hypothetical protein ALMP_80540 [Streptomyces sp. A012304]